MGLFVQNIKLGISDADYLVEKISLPKLTKSKIDVFVKPGTIAIIGGITYKGSERPYKLTVDNLGVKKNSPEAYLIHDKMFDGISMPFFGGQHIVSLSTLPAAKAKFSIVGTAQVEIADYKELAKYFARTITKQDLVDELNKNFKENFNNEVNIAACKYLTSDTTEIALKMALENIAQDVVRSRKTSSALFNMGLLISAKGISMHVNTIGDTDEVVKIIIDALNTKAIVNIDEDVREREERERAAERQHEIDLIKAHNTNLQEITETKNINTNSSGNGKVIINNGKKEPGKNAKKQFCPSCGAKIDDPEDKYCRSCGKKL